MAQQAVIPAVTAARPRNHYPAGIIACGCVAFERQTRTRLYMRQRGEE
jgi:hypothetical protein